MKDDSKTGAKRNKMGVARIGISGWNYRPWRGVFFPIGLTQKDELSFASRQVDTIEVNGSFYSLLRPESVERWYRETPPGFVLAVKGSRFITHMKRLNDAETALANFFASGILALKDKLGPILWQLPPSMPFDAARLASFFDLLPRTTEEAAVLARAHDHRVAGRSYTLAAVRRPVRYALEVRHASFRDPDFVSLLRRHDIALCVADSAGHFPDFEDVTADFVYVRLHGDTKLYESGYGHSALAGWAARIDAWKCGSEIEGARRASPDARPPRAADRDVYVYFDNDARVRAPFDAQALRALVGGEPVPRLPAVLDGAGEEARTRWPMWSGGRGSARAGRAMDRGLLVRNEGRERASQKAPSRRPANQVAKESSMPVKKSTGRKYGKSASSKVGKVMHERKHGTLRSGSDGKKVTSRKQAIAIGLSEARRAGAKVPPKKGAKGRSKKS